jgi:hypothetical protein
MGEFVNQQMRGGSVRNRGINQDQKPGFLFVAFGQVDLQAPEPQRNLQFRVGRFQSG